MTSLLSFPGFPPEFVDGSAIFVAETGESMDPRLKHAGMTEKV
jgi:hypothetical protein